MSESQKTIAVLQEQLKQREEEIRLLQQNRGSVTGMSPSGDGQRIASLEQELSDSLEESTELEKEVKILRQKLSPTESLPIECLQHIISFCNITCVYYSFMTVSKKWNEASHNDLKTRKSMKITMKSRTTNINNLVEDTVFMTRVQDKKKMVEILMRMTGVTHLCLEGLEREDFCLIHPLLKQWSPNLRHLDISCWEFPSLFRLSFPRLVSLKVPRMPMSRDDLPLQQIKRLDVTVSTDRTEGTDLLCGMQHLTHLTVVFVKDEYADLDPDDVHHLESVRRICRSFQKHVIFDLTYDDNDRMHELMKSSDADSLVASLVDTNPQLEGVSLTRLQVTDASLVSLARLKHLKHLTISAKQDKQFYGTTEKLTITGPAIVNFLRTGSQQSLESLTLIRVPELDMQSQAAIEELEDEAGIECNIEL